MAVYRRGTLDSGSLYIALILKFEMTQKKILIFLSEIRKPKIQIHMRIRKAEDKVRKSWQNIMFAICAQ